MNISRSKFNPKFIFLPLGLIMILAVISGIIIHFQHDSSLLRHNRYELTLITRMCKYVLGSLNHKASEEELSKIVEHMGSISQSRISIFNNEGRIIADSSLSKTEILQSGNEISSPEILGAKEKGIGISERFSKVLNSDMLFVAIHHTDENNPGFIRAGKLSTDLRQSLLEQRIILITIYIIMFLLVLLIGILTIYYISSRINKDQELLEEKVKERTSHISMLHQLGTMLTACKTREEAFDIVGRAGARMLPQFFGALSLYRASRNMLEVTITWNGEWQGEKFFQSQECWGLRTGKNHFSENGIISCTHGHGPDNQPMLCIPLVAQGETIGVMHISGKNTDFNTENQNLASAIVEHTGLALANLQLQESLRSQATRDTLTGLYNRRFLAEYFESELNRAARRNKHIGILMLDIDHFKKLNDTYGHDAGDFVLSELGKILSSTLRSEDIICRYGGEEFIILLPETSINDLIPVADKLHEILNSHKINYGSNPLGNITVSIGAACFPDNGRTRDELIKAADIALYEAKKNGRNRTETAKKDIDS